MRSRMLPIAVCAALAPGLAHAQQETPPRGVSVEQRQRPDYDPAGVRAGAFLVLPEVTLEGTYDDNIFATTNNTVDDLVWVVSPRLRVQSDWVRHALAVRTGAALGFHQDNADEDFEDYYAFLDGRLDILTGTTANGTVGYERLHEDRGSPNDVGGQEPAEFDRWRATLDLQRAVTQLRLRGGVFYDSFDFDDVAGLAGSVINQDFRDREGYGTYLRAGYAVSPNFVTFLRGRYNWRRYDTDTGRDSEGYQIDAGAELDFGGITSGEVFIGYREQEYESAAFSPVDGFTYGASVLWNPTPLTSVRFGIVDNIEETIIAGSSSYESVTYSVDVDHELLRNLLIGAGVAYRQEDFQEINREDDFTRFRVSLSYLLNRNFDIEVGYNYDTRSSNTFGRDYDINRYFVGFTASL